MTGNSKEIKNLKHQQAKKKEYIKRYKNRRKKHIFFIMIPFIAYILLYIDNAYKEYGSVINFLIVTLSVLAVFTLIYLLMVRYAIHQKEREIKVIRSKLYQLMKLDDD